MISDIIKTIRVRQWVKNLLVFPALIFSFSFSYGSLKLALIAFFAFCFFSSAVYTINDIFDIHKDRLHPEKKNRPIASGKIQVWQAFSIFILCTLVGSVLASIVSTLFFYVVLFYFAMNLLYSAGLKNMPIVDVMIIASGFVIRVIGGAVAIGVPVSHWLLLCTFFISLFFAFGKRKNEMHVVLADNWSGHRKSIAEYTDGFINQMLSLTAGSALIFYSLYTIDPSTVARFGNDNLIYTTPVVVFGVSRYFFLLFNKNEGGDPAKLFLHDRQLVASVFVWLLSILLMHSRYPLIAGGQ